MQDKEKRKKSTKRKGLKQKKTVLYLQAGVFAASVLLFLFCVCILGEYYIEGTRAEKTFENLKTTVAQTIEEADGTGGKQNAGEAKEPETSWNAEVKALKTAQSQNGDIRAWIRIPDTPIDYPVMYTPDSPGYYLNHGVEKEYSSFGVPYLDERCDMKKSDALVIYGHHMKNGSMFAGLLKYEKEEYYASHPEIFLTTEDGVRIYEVTEAFCLDADTQGDFFDFLDSGKSEDGDSLLFLTTCEYTAKNGRFVVAAVEKNN